MQVIDTDNSGYASSTNTFTINAPLFPGGTALTSLNTLGNTNTQIFNWEDNNYIYFYHTNIVVFLPGYADNVTDSMNINFQSSTPLSRSAPIYSFSNAGPRTVGISFNLHRDMITQLNHDNERLSNAILHSPEGTDQDYVDFIVKQLQTAAVPNYAASEKMVNPPVVALRLSKDIFIKGVISSNVTETYKYPILRNGKYSNIDVTFSLNEVDPYDAEVVSEVGSYRGLSDTLERAIIGALEPYKAKQVPTSNSDAKYIIPNTSTVG